MPKLTGREASSLAYLADCPNAENKDEVIKELGPDARRIAHVIAGRECGCENENDKATAEAIKEWSRKRMGFMTELVHKKANIQNPPYEVIKYLLKEWCSACRNGEKHTHIFRL